MDPIQHTINTIHIDQDDLYLGFGDYRVEIWDLKSFSFKARITGYLWEVKQILTDDNYIFVATLKNECQIYNKNTLELVRSITFEGSVTALAQNEDFLVLGGYNPEVHLIKKGSWEKVNTIPGHSTRVNSLFIHKNQVYSGDGFMDEGRLQAFNLQNYDTSILYDGIKRVNQIVEINGNIFFSTAGPTALFQITTQIEKLPIQVKPISSFAISSEYIVVASTHKITIFDQVSHQLLDSVDLSSDPIALALDENMLVYSHYNKLTVLNVTTMQIVKTIEFDRL